MSLTHIDNHAERALARLLEQFKTSTQLRDFIEALLGPLQATENSMWSLYTERWAGTAIGTQLDILGEIVGQPREGRSDSTYRLWLQARILLNRSTGLADDTLKLLQLLVGDAEYSVTEEPPAGYRVDVFSLQVNHVELFKLLQEVKPAGVDIQFTYSSDPQSGLFTYDVTPYDDMDFVYAGGLS